MVQLLIRLSKPKTVLSIAKATSIFSWIGTSRGFLFGSVITPSSIAFASTSFTGFFTRRLAAPANLTASATASFGNLTSSFPREAKPQAPFTKTLTPAPLSIPVLAPSTLPSLVVKKVLKSCCARTSTYSAPRLCPKSTVLNNSSFKVGFHPIFSCELIFCCILIRR
jgi:hypothetical protein